MKTLGICIGASTISAAAVERDASGAVRLCDVRVDAHHGNPRRYLLELMREVDAARYDRVCVTGRRFRQFLNLSSIPEPEAVEHALAHLNGRGENLEAVVSAGGETFLVYTLGKDGRISTVQTGNKCASGTGEFFLQQIKRLGLDIDEATGLARSESPYRVSGRCSVFCKSDCTHAANKGVPRGRIVAGLCQMMAGKILEILGQVPRRDIMVIGGTARNEVLMDHLRGEIANLRVPDEAPYFEALGAALWALEHETAPFPGPEKLFREGESSFAVLRPLSDFADRVEFRPSRRGEARAGDTLILGLDVGSTTTKAVLLRSEDDTIVASVYLRTGGDPVGASRECYRALREQLGPLAAAVRIEGLGVTGSGRQIAGLHAMTEGIVNEIAAHAAAAVWFDPDVDTIFEIGGQDAKYTFITGGVPSDYAMNEACSAGTGSFLEEAARESLNIATEQIAEIALAGRRPPDFNDQCAAFINSDIKRAFHEGITREDIVAGLVYSICMNYHKRVKGSRAVGKKVFMQGGVCYNRAVPLAMAAVTGRRIIVPPDPGLMGAFGVALEIKRRLALGLMRRQAYSLDALRDRELEYGEPFVCNGGTERCDRRCEIARIRIEGRTYPFGGACNRWYNLRFARKTDTAGLDLAQTWERLVFEGRDTGTDRPAGTVGLNKSFFVNTYYPLYRRFFEELGYRVVLPGAIRPEGVDRRGAAFCWPVEIAHGYLQDLLERGVDWLFLPQFRGGNPQRWGRNGQGPSKSTTCPLSQGEPYYLATAFKDHPAWRALKGAGRILSPVIDFSKGPDAARGDFVDVARALGRSAEAGRSAFEAALAEQAAFVQRMREAGREALEALQADPRAFAVALFGRSYNAFVTESHMGIPQKLATRGIRVIPIDMLPIDDEPVHGQMYWSAGQTILKAASFVARHPQLFGCYVTNFSCGPDSFLLGYFRDLMGEKPSLTLELDSHTADAGLETRIEAFLGIVEAWREMKGKRSTGGGALPRAFTPSRFDYRDQLFIDSQGKPHSFLDPRVHLLFPSMGRLNSEAMSAVFRGLGIRSSCLPPADRRDLETGKGNSLCKECLPLQLVTGGLLNYLEGRERRDELLLYVMPTTSGPCRFGQYAPFIERVLEKRRIDDVALFSLSGENSYSDFHGSSFTKKAWSAIVLADVMHDVYSMLLACAARRPRAMEIFWEGWSRLLGVLERGCDPRALRETVSSIAQDLARIELRRRPAETPLILLTGEIFVRHDDLSRQWIVERLADEGFAVKVSSGMEWIYYTDWCYANRMTAGDISVRQWLQLMLRQAVMRRQERFLKGLLRPSGLFHYRREDVDRLIDGVRHLMNPRLVGEAILTVGAALTEVPDDYCGAIAIGPFGCMPNRIAEAILSREMTREGKSALKAVNPRVRRVLERFDHLPFLAIESDGSPFPQIVTARLETFLLQARRVHEAMRASPPVRSGASVAAAVPDEICCAARVGLPRETRDRSD
ncbi:MAG: activase [Syntrophaceae bacterium]|nr:activase [Syntrophaceae bacterium]